LYVLPLRGSPLATGIVVGLALLTFVPSLYLYPSQKGRLNRLTNLLAVPGSLLLLGALWLLPREGGVPPAAPALAPPALYFPAYYLLASWAVTLRRWRAHRRDATFL